MVSQESTWIIQAQAGDTDAFTRLVEAYQRPVYNLCYRMLSNAQDAEDAAQETFLRAYRSIRKFDNQRSFTTWILSIASHYCIDQIRRHKFDVSIEDLPYQDLPDSEPGIEAQHGRRSEQQQIQGLLLLLEPIDRAVVVMYYWNDMSLQEIGSTLNITESAVKSRLHRARRTLAQKWLDQPGQGPVQVEGMVA